MPPCAVSPAAHTASRQAEEDGWTHVPRPRVALIREGWRQAMKASTRHRAKGKLDKLKGTIKEAAGIITGRRKLKGKGKRQKLAGKAREKLGQVEKALGK